MNDRLLLALSAGTLAALNPCGFALLPAYLTLLITRSDSGRPVPRALLATGAMTAGFVLVFGAFGLVVVPLALSLGTALSWATVVIGIALVLLGIWLLSGHDVVLRLPHVRGAAPTGGGWSMLLYGVAYAVASLSCTVAPFLAVTTSTFRAEGVLDGLAVYVAYALGMGLVVGVLSLAVALAQDGIVRQVRRIVPYIGRISGVLLLVAGAYVTYYGLYEIRLSRGAAANDPVIDAATDVQGAIARWVDGINAWTLVAAMLVLVGAGVLLRLTRRPGGAAGSNTQRSSSHRPASRSGR